MAAVLKQVENGAVSFGTGDTAITFTLLTPLTDTSKTFLVYSLKKC